MSDTVPVNSDSDVSSIPTIFDPATCTRKGLCPVTQLRHDGSPLSSHSLYFEQHGTGPEKIVFIMGCVARVSDRTPGLTRRSCMDVAAGAQAEQHVLLVVPAGRPLRAQAGVLDTRVRQQRRGEQRGAPRAVYVRPSHTKDRRVLQITSTLAGRAQWRRT